MGRRREARKEDPPRRRAPPPDDDAGTEGSKKKMDGGGRNGGLFVVCPPEDADGLGISPLYLCVGRLVGAMAVADPSRRRDLLRSPGGEGCKKLARCAANASTILISPSDGKPQ